MKGGYQVIDLKNNDLQTEGGITIKDAFKKVNAGKAILFENVLIGVIKIPAMFAYAQILENGSNVIPITLSTGETNVIGSLSISDSDVITLAIESGEG